MTTETKPAELLVPARLYDAALAFCNARRAEKGEPPIAELPAGYASQHRQCPCANSTGDLSFGETSYWLGSLVGEGKPHGISDFVNYFDTRAKPGILTKPIRAEGIYG